MLGARELDGAQVSGAKPTMPAAERHLDAW
jgi:hypothetical protein